MRSTIAIRGAFPFSPLGVSGEAVSLTQVFFPVTFAKTLVFIRGFPQNCWKFSIPVFSLLLRFKLTRSGWSAVV